MCYYEENAVKQIVRVAHLASIMVAGGFIILGVSYTSVHAAPKDYKGNGNHYGWGYGGNGGGAPLPALGATLLGQAAGAGGLYALWRRRQKRRNNKRQA